ncbi:LppP/LprE family lipoprotein [Aquihabitans sp. G128]|uniref:LppP/LprE family lipoprotein n=1 Tax=Aquihabitans sp. G128 TaxID=2849779 RepID=UPI001C248CE0|nr:LppP/LprE family lipoprotein [Aquihabitans sp. G128]QXC63138.1 LppP/LprE family lipoprotein [Aquihabitans sp. G128]
MTLRLARTARPRRAGAAVAVAATLVLGLAGCGASGGGSDGAGATSTTVAKGTTSTSTGSTTTTVVATSTTVAPASTTVPPTATSAPAATTPPTTAAGGTTNGGGGSNVPLTAEQAAAKVKATGDWDVELGTYDPRARLTAVLARASGAMSAAAPEQVFFFSNGQYLGPATKTERTAISIDASSGEQVVVTYGHFAAGDPNCCPSQAPWVVTFTISGAGKLLVSGELPPEGQGQF